METLEAIFTRRSVRHFTGKPVPPNLVNTLLRAAMYAPSARNQQEWHFVVITDREKLEEITLVHPYAQSLKEAALAVLVCADESIQPDPGYWSLDCAAAMQNLLLAAHASGLGAVWLGVSPRKERMDAIRRVTGLPDGIQPVALAAIGWPAEMPTTEERFKEERVHTNQF